MDRMSTYRLDPSKKLSRLTTRVPDTSVKSYYFQGDIVECRVEKLGTVVNKVV